jgi:hypothetical protein
VLMKLVEGSVFGFVRWVGAVGWEVIYERRGPVRG